MKRTFFSLAVFALSFSAVSAQADWRETDTFKNPRLDGLPVSACATNGHILFQDQSDCGSKAAAMVAHYFCRRNGYNFGTGHINELSEPISTQQIQFEVAIKKGKRELKADFAEESSKTVFADITCVKGSFSGYEDADNP